MTLSKNKRLIAIITGITVVLLLPLIAMIFTEEVNWSTFDFVVAGILLYGTGLTIELILRKFQKPHQRAIFLLSILSILVLLWLELAVGLFGSPISGS